VWINICSSVTLHIVFHERTKHIEIDYHIVREKLQSGIISPYQHSTNSHIFLRRPWARNKFSFWRHLNFTVTIKPYSSKPSISWTHKTHWDRLPHCARKITSWDNQSFICTDTVSTRWYFYEDTRQWTIFDATTQVGFMIFTYQLEGSIKEIIIIKL